MDNFEKSKWLDTNNNTIDSIEHDELNATSVEIQIENTNQSESE